MSGDRGGSGPILLPGPFTVADYYRMVEAGLLDEDSGVELLDGQVILKDPITPAHAACVTQLGQWLAQRVRGRAIVSIQNPVRLDDRWEPEPDIALLRPTYSYRVGHPGPADVLLLVEVVDGDAAKERAIKLPKYAASGVGEVWLVDARGRTIEACSEPSASGYATVRALGHLDTVSPRAFPDLRIRAAEILMESS